MSRVLIALLGLILIAIMWLTAASCVFLWLANLWDSPEIPSWTRPWQWLVYLQRGDGSFSEWVYLIASAVVASAPLVFCTRFFSLGRIVGGARLRPLRAGRTGGGLRPLKPGVTDNLGHAAWAPPEQVAKRFRGPGCLIGAMDRSPTAQLLFDDIGVGPGHAFVFSGPGSHKTMTAVNRIWNWPGPRVVFDPSCEIGPIMTDALRAADYNVYTIGLNGQGINVLDWIDVTLPESDAHIRSAVDWIYSEDATSRSGGSQSRDPFWSTWGRSLVACLMADMLHSKSGPKTVAALRRGLATPENLMPELLANIHRQSDSRMARDLSGGLMGMKAEETFSGIYANSFSATEYLATGAYADVLSGDAMPTSAILDSSTVVFVQLPLRSLLATPAIGRAVMGALFNAMFHADGSGITDRILWQIDEAWVLGRLKEIMLCHTTARKYRGCVNTIWQSEGQLEEIWGREGAKTMRDTVSWRSYNAVSDGDIAEKLSRDIGEHAVMAFSEGANRGDQRQPFSWWGSRSTGLTTNMHEVKRRLLKADEILRAPADEMFVLCRDMPWPIRCVTAPFYRYQDIAKVMSENRFARGQ